MFFNRFGKHASMVRPVASTNLKEPLTAALISEFGKKSEKSETQGLRRAVALALATQFALPIGLLAPTSHSSAQTTAPADASAAPTTAPSAGPATPDATAGNSPATAPATAPTTDAMPAPVAAPAAVTPPPAPVAATPAPAPMPSPAPVAVAAPASPEDQAATDALKAAVTYKRIQQQQAAYSAQKLVEKARDEQSKSQISDALRDYQEATRLDPNNEQARAGYSEVLDLSGALPRPPAQTQDKEIQEQREAIQYRFNSAIARANGDISANKWSDAEKDIGDARVASRNNPSLFTQPQLNDFDTTISNTETHLQTIKSQADAVATGKAEADATAAQAEKEERYKQENERTIANLIQDARQYANDGKYREALAVIDHIQKLDPTNSYAGDNRPYLEDKANNQEQREYREKFDVNFTKTLNASQEQKIPYADIIRYSDDWPKISEMRDDEVKSDRGEDEEDAQLQAQLDRHLPELRFNANALSDVIDFLRDMTGANIYVDWPALERASIAKDAQVTARLRDIKFSKALDLIFKSVEGEDDDHKLGYTLDEGVITISTRKELNKDVVTRKYDINDLLFVAPDYNNAPDLSLQNASQGTSGGGGGGGGGGGQSLFTGSNTGQNQQNQANQRATTIDEVKKYITDNVDTNSWKDNGGDVGTISSSPLRAVLLITQTGDNQKKIQSVLDSLRASQSLQVSVETRFLIVQRNYLEDIGVDANFTFNPLQQPGNTRSGYNSSRFSPITVSQSAVSNNTTFTDANGNVTNSTSGSRTLDWISNVGNAAVPGSIAANPADYPNPIVIQGSYVDNFTVNFLIRAVEANQSTISLTAPRVTLFSGQWALLVVETQQAYVSNLTPVVAPGAALFDPTVSTTTATGVVLSLQATVSPDRKYVFMNLLPQLARLRALVPFAISAVVQPVTTGLVTSAPQIVQGTLQLPTIDLTIVKTSCAVPDGATLLLGGQTLAAETTREQGVPVLSKIPFLKRLFTNRATSQDEQILLILVKPTILIQHEQEQKQFPQLSSKAS